MPATEVSRWAKKARDAIARRNDAIKAMHEEGATLREIAVAAELSHTAIAKILAKG